MNNMCIESIYGMEEEDEKWMERAFEEAQIALDNDEVPVGCVFVHNGQEVGCGRNRANETKDATSHAEMVALRRMEETIPNLREILPELILYVTLEPCIMCACGLYELGIKKVIYSAANDRFGGVKSVGNATKYKSEHTFEVVDGVQAERSIALLKQFYSKQNRFAPEDKRKTKDKTKSIKLNDDQ